MTNCNVLDITDRLLANLERKIELTKRNKKYQNKLTALIRGLNSVGVTDKVKTSTSRQQTLKSQKEASKNNLIACTKDINLAKSKLDLRKDDSSIELAGQNQLSSLEYKPVKISDPNQANLTAEVKIPKHKY